MTYLTERQLRGAVELSESMTYKSLLKASKAEASVGVFLSHSHLDRNLVERLKFVLARAGRVSLYVDWRDTAMPPVTNRETARMIKRKIAEPDCFLILATRNAMDSKWVPWEIGIADATKPTDDIAVIPIEDDNGNYGGNEYMQLYQRIVIADFGILAVFPPRVTNGISFESWIATRRSLHQ